MPDWKPMGEAAYNELLKQVLLLPFDARQVADTRRGGARALSRALGGNAQGSEPVHRPDPSRAKHVPKDQAEFLSAYEVTPAGDDRVHAGEPSDHAARLSRRRSRSASFRRPSSQRARWLHESAGHL